jgi:hypothetical protein
VSDVEIFPTPKEILRVSIKCDKREQASGYQRLKGQVFFMQLTKPENDIKN